MSLVENLAAYMTDFGVDATIGAATVRGIFDDAYADPLNFAGSAPALTVASAEVSGVAQDAAVVVNGVNYTVASIKPDGTGVTLLVLQES